MTKAEIVHAPEAVRRAEEEAREDESAPKVGRWYWVTDKEEGEQGGADRDEEEDDEQKEKWFGCVTHVGSNYAEVTTPGGGHERIHEDEFYDRCEPIADPRAIIDAEIGKRQTNIHVLMEEVKAITRRLAVSPAGAALPAASETKALALRGSGEDLGKYKTALSRAKEKELPELFKQIKEANEGLGLWLSAELIPLKAQAKAMKPAIGAIEERIFSVELYAGLSEEIELIRDGQAAAAYEKIHLMQRRCYMDEECLARYEAGGMEFKDVGAFHAWLARPENLPRILPFPKCITSFRVRRNKKDRAWDGSLSSYFRIVDEENTDKLTFLYIRNGEKLYCLATSIEFDEKLFPDMDHALLRNDGRGTLYGKVWTAGRVDKIISEQEYLAMKKECEEAAEGDKWYLRHDLRDYHPFERGDVFYDDIHKHIQSELKKHNRLMLVLQGLLDRSPVLHPHPPWAIWTPEGFEEGLSLVYDDSRALTAGDKPDFEAYRAKLNASITAGSITVGQEDFWEEVEAEKENDRRDRDHRWGEYRPKRYRPHGNPGPGTLARVVRATKGRCTFEWERERQQRWNEWGEDKGKTVRCALTAPRERLLNASAYAPGDFKIFFDDPRTRAEYLEWAPLLLEAEEYHAGNREVAPPPASRKKVATAAGAYKYKMKKARQALHNKAVRLSEEISTKGGKIYPRGSLWRVVAWGGGLFDIEGIDEDGARAKDGRYVRGVEMSSLTIDESVPAPNGPRE